MQLAKAMDKSSASMTLCPVAATWLSCGCAALQRPAHKQHQNCLLVNTQHV